jgi:hypothetical protein
LTYLNLVFFMSSLVFNMCNWGYQINAIKFVLFGRALSNRLIVISMMLSHFLLFVFIIFISLFACFAQREYYSAQSISDIISSVFLLMVSISYVYVGRKFLNFASLVQISDFQEIKRRGVTTMILISVLFFFKTVFNFLRGILRFDQVFSQKAFEDNYLSYGVYYFFYVFVFDLLPKITLVYSARLAINKNLGKNNEYENIKGDMTNSYESSFLGSVENSRNEE